MKGTYERQWFGYSEGSIFFFSFFFLQHLHLPHLADDLKIALISRTFSHICSHHSTNFKNCHSELLKTKIQKCILLNCLCFITDNYESRKFNLLIFPAAKTLKAKF